VTRGSLSLLAGLGGLLLAAGSIALVFFFSGIFASAHTRHLTGPGLDVFVRTPFPTTDSEIVLDVASRGPFGSRAGIELVTVSAADEKLAIKYGKGDITPPSGRMRGGSETVRVGFPVRLATRSGTTLSLVIEVDWVFGHRKQSDTLRLPLEIHTAAGRKVAQLVRVLLALSAFLAWLAILWTIVRLYIKVSPGAPSKLEGTGLFVGFLGGASLGYWFFVWPLVTALELHAFGWSAFLFLVWAIAPPVLVQRWAKRPERPKRPKRRKKR
jgi:hypothetical protein